jgi:hypothetical protein
MAYEELTVYAIQDDNLKAFAHRFRTYPSREDRDEALDFMKHNLDARTASMRHPVKLKVIVYTDEDRQMALDLRKSG